jgi:hypothetical protein
MCINPNELFADEGADDFCYECGEQLKDWERTEIMAMYGGVLNSDIERVVLLANHRTCQGCWNEYGTYIIEYEDEERGYEEIIILGLQWVDPDRVDGVDELEGVYSIQIVASSDDWADPRAWGDFLDDEYDWVAL